MKIEINLEVIINKLDHKVNDFTVRKHELANLGDIKDKLEATYRCELRKELLSLSLDNETTLIIGDIASSGDVERDHREIAIGNPKIAQLRLNRDLAKMRYYSMKSSIEDIKFEIEVLRSMLTCLRGDFSVLKGKKVPWLN